MAESVAENTGFSQDLFSPLQFCEVVEEGQQHRQRMQQLQHHQSQINEPQITTLQSANPNHHHNQQHQLTSQQSQIQAPNQQIIHPVKQESPQNQPIQTQVLNVSDPKNQSFSAMEIYLTGNPVHLQPVTVPLVSVNQSHIAQPMYEVQLTRQQQQTIQQIQLSPLHIQNHPATQQTIQIPNQNAQQTNQTINVGNLVSIGDVSGSFVPTISTVPNKVENITSTVTHTSQLNHIPERRSEIISQLEDDEPQIVFTNVSAAQDSSTQSSASSVISVTKSEISSENTQIKPIPVKRTWRRPWKKKKEREKKPAIKKSRKVKRKRVIIQKRNVVRIDPRYGPPIDTSKTVVERGSEDSINQLKQKRQRIKLNRNSGREYVNRLGKVVNARKIGSPCNCPLKCWDRMGSKVVDIFNNFWDLCDFNLQNSYLFTCLKLCDVKRRYTKRPADESRRQNTFEYFVRITGKHLKVCKKAFMSSHGLTSDKRLRTLFTQMKDGALIPELDKRGKHARMMRGHEPNSNQHMNPLSQNNSLTNCVNTSNKAVQTHTNNKTSKSKSKAKKKVNPPSQRLEINKQAMYAPPPHAVTHLHPHCTPPPPPHAASMQEPPHTYIPNGEIYFPGHYLDPHQAMAHQHMNQIQGCQKMLETPAYFMAGMKENTFHQ